MARMQLFEIEDQAWCPQIIRESTTDFLRGLYQVFNIYQPAFEKINEILQKTHTTHIIDCCSGSGGPIDQLRNYLDTHGNEAVTITLTDKYPNIAIYENFEHKFPHKVTGHRASIDATKMPVHLHGMRTFFSSFHHFSRDNAIKILQDAVNNHCSIGIFESTQRAPADFMRMLISPIMMLFIVPFAKRLTWKKFLFTYIFPIALFTTMWDYFVSNLRTYSETEMRDLINQLHAPGYQWEIGKLWSKKAKCFIPYLTGYKQ